MATGIDVSEWDNGRHPGAVTASWFAAWDFVIVRSHNENGYADRYAAANIAAAKASGKPWGIYAWPVVGSGSNRALGKAIVDAYGIPPLGVWADAEHSGRGFASAEEVEEFCRGAQDGGALAGYYCAIGELHRSSYLDGLAWWVADYGPNDGQYHDPAEQAPRPPSDRPWAIHQFTSLGWPDGGALDVNYAPSLDFAGATPAREEDDEMKIAWGDSVFGARVAGVVDGGLLGELFTGPPHPEYGIPVDAIEWNSAKGRGLGWVLLDPERLGDALQPRATVTVPGDCPDCPPGLDAATPIELVDALRGRLK